MLERPESPKKIKNVEEIEEAEVELNRYKRLNVYLRRITAQEAEAKYRNLTVSSGLVSKAKENGKEKRRIVIDLKRKATQKAFSRRNYIILPRLSELMQEIRKISATPGDAEDEAELEAALVDVADAFKVLPVAEKELKHTLSTRPNELLVFQALLFGYKVARLMRSKLPTLTRTSASITSTTN